MHRISHTCIRGLAGGEGALDSGRSEDQDLRTVGMPLGGEAREVQSARRGTCSSPDPRNERFCSTSGVCIQDDRCKEGQERPRKATFQSVLASSDRWQVSGAAPRAGRSIPKRPAGGRGAPVAGCEATTCTPAEGRIPNLGRIPPPDMGHDPQCRFRMVRSKMLHGLPHVWWRCLVVPHGSIHPIGCNFPWLDRSESRHHTGFSGHGDALRSPHAGQYGLWMPALL